jgi:predicted MPP superfamily phosphohydrolase
MNRRAFLRGMAATAVGAFGVSTIVRGFHTHAFEEKTVRLRLGLNQRLRLAVLGDIHFDPIYEDAYLAEVASSLTALEADLIAYTGDFFTGTARRAQDLAALLSSATARLGSYAVLGNHDYLVGRRLVSQALDRVGIRVLRNESVPIPGEDHVYLTGLDSFFYGQPERQIFSRTPEDSRHITLVHEPDAFVELTDPRLSLQVSGHTHGGQIRAPYVGALLLPKWGRLFQQGLYRSDGRWLYVNRGIGTLRPHVRYHCRPEITVFELT